MAGSTKRIDVTTTPTLITTVPGDSISGASCAVRNPESNTASVWVGYVNTITPGTVKATDGFEIPPGYTHVVDLDPGETQYLVCASGTVTVYLEQRGV